MLLEAVITSWVMRDTDTVSRSSAAMVWTTTHWEKSTRRWYWRNCSTHLQHGGGSRELHTGSELTHSFVAVSDSVYTALANQHPRNWSTQLTMHCLNASSTTQTMCYIHASWSQHNRLLPETATPRQKTGCMQSNNFLTRLLYKNLYWHITYSAVSNSPTWTDFILSYIVIYFVFCTFFSETFVLRCVLPSFNKPILIDWSEALANSKQLAKPV